MELPMIKYPYGAQHRFSITPVAPWKPVSPSKDFTEEEWNSFSEQKRAFLAHNEAEEAIGDYVQVKLIPEGEDLA